MDHARVLPILAYRRNIAQVGQSPAKLSKPVRHSNTRPAQALLAIYLTVYLSDGNACSQYVQHMYGVHPLRKCFYTLNLMES